MNSPFKIRIYPEPCLRRVAVPVQRVDAQIQQLADDMIRTMYENQGIGLAAVQVNVMQRIVVLDVSEEKNHAQVFINPELVHSEGTVEWEEGCLSLPGITAPVQRAASVRVRALNRAGKMRDVEAEGMLAICLQHEIDHLNGKLFIDYLSRHKRERLLAKMTKQLAQDKLSDGAEQPNLVLSANL